MVELIDRTRGSRGSDINVEGLKRRPLGSGTSSGVVAKGDEGTPLVATSSRHSRNTSSTSESAI